MYMYTKSSPPPPPPSPFEKIFPNRRQITDHMQTRNRNRRRHSVARVFVCWLRECVVIIRF